MDDKTKEDLEDIEAVVMDELAMLISGASVDCKMLDDIQPPTSIIQLMAEAAAKVLMAFERGYRMGD